MSPISASTPSALIGAPRAFLSGTAVNGTGSEGRAKGDADGWLASRRAHRDIEHLAAREAGLKRLLLLQSLLAFLAVRLQVLWELCEAKWKTRL